MSERDGRCAFCHAVAGDERSLELDGEKLLDVVRNGGATCNEHLDVAAHRSHENGPERLAEFRIVLIVGKFCPAGLAVYKLSYGVVYHFPENQRNGEEYPWTEFAQGRL